MKIPTAKKLPSGRWRVQIMVDGDRLSITADTKKECERKAAMIKSGVESAKRRDKVTLYQAITEYIDQKRPALSPSTVRGYLIIRDTYFQSIMEMDVATITQKALQAAVNAELRTRSVKTVRNALGLVRPSMALYGAVIDVSLPQAVKPVKKYLQPGDIGKLIDAARGDLCEIPILLAVWLGMRRSEILGLCWDMVDPDRSILHIRRSVVVNEHNEWILKEYPKNSSSQRSIQCPEYIMDMIRQLPHDQDRLFMFHPDTIRRHVHKVCAKAGITDTTTHGLRHTNAAVMKSLGIDDAYAMARGGWSSESTYKKTYSYVFDSTAETDDTMIDDYFAHEIAHGNSES